MKNNETEYLNTLFAGSSDESDESAIDFPLIDVPENLSHRLYAISDSTLSSSAPTKQRSFSLKSWPKLTSIAASLLIAVVLVQGYQQQQTLKRLEQAQADLAMALHYLGEANQITRAQMLNSLNQNMKKAALLPVMEIGRDAVIPTVESLEFETKKTHRTL
jgi:hypothetical protein